MITETRRERTPWHMRLLVGRPAWREVTEITFAGVGGMFNRKKRSLPALRPGKDEFLGLRVEGHAGEIDDPLGAE